MASPPAHSRVSGNPGAAVRGPGSPLSRGRTEKCVDRLCVPAGVHPAKAGAGTSGGNFFDYTPTTLLTTHRGYARRYAASLIEGVVRRHPEGGARRGVLRRRLVTACPGRPGTPPARHYDLAARSSLHGSARQLPAVSRTAGAEGDGSAAPRPRPATVERREASVPRYGTQGASLGAWRAASCARLTGVPPSTRTFLGAPPTPRFGVSEAKSQSPGRKNAPRERDGLFEIVRWNDGERFSDDLQFCTRARPHPEERVGWSGPANSNARMRVSKDEDEPMRAPSCFETHRSAPMPWTRLCSRWRCDAPQHEGAGARRILASQAAARPRTTNLRLRETIAGSPCLFPACYLQG